MFRGRAHKLVLLILQVHICSKIPPPPGFCSAGTYTTFFKICKTPKQMIWKKHCSLTAKTRFWIIFCRVVFCKAAFLSAGRKPYSCPSCDFFLCHTRSSFALLSSSLPHICDLHTHKKRDKIRFFSYIECPPKTPKIYFFNYNKYKSKASDIIVRYLIKAAGLSNHLINRVTPQFVAKKEVHVTEVVTHWKHQQYVSLYRVFNKDWNAL